MSGKKLRNPFLQYKDYNCFGCSPVNDNGLRLKFVEEGDSLISEWTPTKQFQGYFNVLHGGIQATLLDEIASWVVYVKLKRAGVTSSMNIRYLKPVAIAEGKVRLESRLKQMRRNLADIEAKLINSRDEVCAEGIITYFTFSEEQSRENLYYPGPEEFYEK